jgi:hypothetical protein
LRWLAKIPGAPQFFDAMLLALTALFRPACLRGISAIESNVRTWPEFRVGTHRLGGIGFFFRGRESSHIHGNGLLDCFVGRENRERLVADGRALPHHIFPRSGWISFWVREEADVEEALELIQIAGQQK